MAASACASGSEGGGLRRGHCPKKRCKTTPIDLVEPVDDQIPNPRERGRMGASNVCSHFSTGAMPWRRRQEDLTFKKSIK